MSPTLIISSQKLQSVKWGSLCPYSSLAIERKKLSHLRWARHVIPGTRSVPGQCLGYLLPGVVTHLIGKNGKGAKGAPSPAMSGRPGLLGLPGTECLTCTGGEAKIRG